jgi:hypothetical protein
MQQGMPLILPKAAIIQAQATKMPEQENIYPLVMEAVDLVKSIDPWQHFATRQTSTFASQRKYLSVLMQQIVVFLISSQTEISSRCLFDFYICKTLF